MVSHCMCWCGKRAAKKDRLFGGIQLKRVSIKLPQCQWQRLSVLKGPVWQATLSLHRFSNELIRRRKEEWPSYRVGHLYRWLRRGANSLFVAVSVSSLGCTHRLQSLLSL